MVGFAAAGFWVFDLFNHFRVQYLGASVLGLLLALFLRSKRLALIFAAVALFNAIFIVPLFVPPPDAPADIRELSIISSNTWSHNNDWASVRQVLLEGNPDVAFFTETHPDIQAGIQELEPDFHIFRRESDVLLVRRRAGLSPVLMETPAGDNIAGIPVKLSLEGAGITLLAIHPAAPGSSAAAGARDQSFTAIASFLERQKGVKIVVGDFNATPWSRAFRVLQEQTGLVNSQRGFGIQSTWPSYPGSCMNWLLRIPIDHCLHSPAVHTIDRSVGEHGHSNHNPLFLRLGIPAGPGAGGDSQAARPG